MPQNIDFFKLKSEQQVISGLQNYRSELEVVSLEGELLGECPFANFILVGIELDEQELLEVCDIVKYPPWGLSQKPLGRLSSRFQIWLW